MFRRPVQTQPETVGFITCPSLKEVSELLKIKFEIAATELRIHYRQTLEVVPWDRVLDIRHTVQPGMVMTWLAYLHEGKVRWTGYGQSAPLLKPKNQVQKATDDLQKAIGTTKYPISYSEDPDVNGGWASVCTDTELSSAISTDLLPGELVRSTFTTPLGGVIVTDRRLLHADLLPPVNSEGQSRWRIQAIDLKDIAFRGQATAKDAKVTVPFRQQQTPPLELIVATDQAQALATAINQAAKACHMDLTRGLPLDGKTLLIDVAFAALLTLGIYGASLDAHITLYVTLAICLLSSLPAILLSALIVAITHFFPPGLLVMAALLIFGLISRFQWLVTNFMAIGTSIAYFVYLGNIIYHHWTITTPFVPGTELYLAAGKTFALFFAGVVILRQQYRNAPWVLPIIFLSTPGAILSLLMPFLSHAFAAGHGGVGHPVPHTTGTDAGHLVGSTHHQVTSTHLHHVNAYYRHTPHGLVYVREHMAADPYTKGT